MSKIRRSQHPHKSRQAPPQYYNGEDDTGETATSVGFAVVLLCSVIIASSTWLGGGVPSLTTHFGNIFDGGARALGLSVSQVSVFGVESGSDLERAIRTSARIEPGENMWRAKPARIRANILALGQVQNVRVARYWPNQIVIIAEPINPIAHLSVGEEYFWVDGKGNKHKQDELLLTMGNTPLLPVQGAGAAANIPALLDVINPQSLQLSHAIWHNNRRWVLVLESGSLVHLPVSGGANDFTMNTEQLLGWLTSTMAEDVKSLDFRVDGRVIVKTTDINKTKQNIRRGFYHG